MTHDRALVLPDGIDDDDDDCGWLVRDLDIVIVLPPPFFYNGRSHSLKWQCWTGVSEESRHPLAVLCLSGTVLLVLHR